MKIVINHLTRMAGGICVAGLDLNTGNHIRPISGAQLTAQLLVRNGGPFDIGHIVDLGNVTAQPRAPRVEDHLFNEQQAETLGMQNATDYWDLLNTVSQNDLANVFGTGLVVTPTQKAYLPGWTGNASLGCLIPIDPPEFFVDWDVLRIRVKALLMGNVVDLNLSPTDIRVYHADHTTPDFGALALNRRMQRESVILAIGVGYPTPPSQYYPQAHWLQVNAIHLSGDPTWQLG